MGVVLFTRSVLHAAAMIFDSNCERLTVNSFDRVRNLGTQLFRKMRVTDVIFVFCLRMTFVNSLYQCFTTTTNCLPRLIFKGETSINIVPYSEDAFGLKE